MAVTDLDIIINHFAKDKFINQLGATIIELKQGYAKTQLIINPLHHNAYGIVHGGVLFSLADFTLGLVSASYGNINLTMQASINFFHPSKSGILTAETKELSKGRKISNYQIDITNEKNKLVASMLGIAYDKGQNIE